MAEKQAFLHINETEEAPEDRYSSESKLSEVRRKIFVLLHQPSSSKVAFYIQLLTSAVIVVSSIAFMVSSLPYFWLHHNETVLYLLFNEVDGYDSFRYDIETITISIFTAEYVISLLTAPRWYKWIIGMS